MPYKVVGKRVYKIENGKRVLVPGGSHQTHAEAVAHMKALYANVPEARGEGKR